MHIPHSYTLWHIQFEPESFVDGLLGIGGTSKSEGKALASRLSQMRKERNERAKQTATIKKDQPSPQSSVGLNNIGGIMGAMSTADAGMGEMELITPGGGGGSGGGSRGKSKNKKKKKGKR